MFLCPTPPNNTALLLVTDVRVKASQGGGLSPVTAGEIHWPERDNIGHQLLDSSTVTVQCGYYISHDHVMWSTCTCTFTRQLYSSDSGIKVHFMQWVFHAFLARGHRRIPMPDRKQAV